MEKREIYKPKYFKPYELLPPEVYTHKVYNSEEEAYKVLNELMDYAGDLKPADASGT